MGDLCTVNITVGVAIEKSDAEVVKSVFGEPDEVDCENAYSVTLTFYDVNYGGVNEMKQLRKSGIKFTAFSGVGEEYDPCLYASSGKQFASCRANRNGSAVIQLEGASLCLADMIAAREYYELNDKIQATWRESNLRYICSARARKKEQDK